jgi:hypothetical protein
LAIKKTQRGVVMKGFCCIWFVCLVWCVTPACAGVVRNGSFEMDGPIYQVTANARPRYWCDVNYNPSKFSAYVLDDWKTDGTYSLTLYTYTASFQQNDAITISQSVYLKNVQQVVFDAYFSANNGWLPDIVTARVLIEGNEVWNSDGLTFSGGQFEGEISIDVNENLKDENNHLLSLQLRVDIATHAFDQYVAQWDNIRFSGCSSPGDFTGDCVVDINDLVIFANGWLKGGATDLTGDGATNFADFAVFANFWGATGNLSPTQPPESNLLDADLNDDGIVDYGDILVFSENWLGDGGPCVRADLNKDGVVDFADFAILANSWHQTGSLYGW